MNGQSDRESEMTGAAERPDAGGSEPQEGVQRPPPRPDEMPGWRLREARERQSLDIDEVAERLHLQPAQVRALEEDDYGHFSAPIFVSGYLRNYARMLGLDPEPLVDAYERQGVEEPPILSELTAKMPATRRRSMSTETWAGLMVVAALAVLALLWSLTRPVGEAPVEPERSAPADSAAPSPAPGEVAPVDEVPAPVSPAPVGETARVPAAQDPEAPLDELSLRFTEDSWVEIADVTGRRLMYRMGQAGQRVTLRGLAPFDILLGNAPAVTIEYNGEPYQDVPITRQNVASFRLGGSN